MVPHICHKGPITLEVDTNGALLWKLILTLRMREMNWNKNIVRKLFSVQVRRLSHLKRVIKKYTSLSMPPPSQPLAAQACKFVNF
jgi:hypothetical protein